MFFFISINVKIFEICLCKNFDIFFVLAKLKYIIFWHGTRFDYIQTYVVDDYTNKSIQLDTDTCQCSNPISLPSPSLFLFLVRFFSLALVPPPPPLSSPTTETQTQTYNRIMFPLAKTWFHYICCIKESWFHENKKKNHPLRCGE